MVKSLRKLVIVGLLSLLLFVGITACSPQPPSRFDQAQQESTQKGVKAVDKKSEQGSSFNKFFPKAGNGYDRVYTQEKKGFAEAKLKKDANKISDIESINFPKNVFFL